MKHPVMWFEVLGQDGSKLQQFYSRLFGWKLNADNPMNYGMLDANGRGIPGGIGASYPGTRPWVTFYVETPDPAATLTDAERLGGRVVMPVREFPDTTIALFEDPEGHVIGLVKARPE
jgi:predicted enzyme related to lactoylglutathione lyase